MKAVLIAMALVRSSNVVVPRPAIFHRAILVASEKDAVDHFEGTLHGVNAATYTCRREQPETWSSNTPFTETLVGEGVWILWKEEGPVGTSFFGRVTHYNKDTGFHYVEYEDGDKGYEDMNHPLARWISVGPC